MEPKISQPSGVSVRLSEGCNPIEIKLVPDREGRLNDAYIHGNYCPAAQLIEALEALKPLVGKKIVTQVLA